MAGNAQQQHKAPIAYVNDVDCQTSFMNLLNAKGLHGHVSCAFIRELYTTARCDKEFDLSKARQQYKDFLGPDCDKRITAFEETEKDEKVAAQAVMHFYTAHEAQLLSALSWTNWLYYNVVVKAERTAASMGIGASLYGGWKLLDNSFAKVRAARYQQSLAALQQPVE